ncbi:MAG TPA: ATP-binding protein [Thermoprotei archaeon]|nr:ATP-binding protein [Thermoprotei archaeon]
MQGMGVTINEQRLQINGQQLQRPWIGTFSVQENQVIQVFQSLNGQPGNAISPIGTPLFFSSDLIQDAVRFMHSNWIFIANSGAPLEVAKEISEFSNEKYMGLTDEPFINGNALYAYRLDGKRIRLADLGFGIQDYVAVRLLYEYIKPKFVLWDDAESHLNPLAIIRVAEWLSGLKDTNVVITTHSLELAQIMLEGVEDRGAAILLSLDKGKLKSKKMTAKELDELRAAGVDARLAEGLLL